MVPALGHALFLGPIEEFGWRGVALPLMQRKFNPFWAGWILTPLFNASRGSLLIAALYHLQMMNPIFPDAQPWDSVLFIITAIIIVWLNRRQMFQKGSGVTEVICPEKGPR